MASELYNGEVYDAHVHFWKMDGTQPRYPFLLELRKIYDSGDTAKLKEVMQRDFAALNNGYAGEDLGRWLRDFGPKDLLAEAEGQNIAAIGYIEAAWVANRVDEIKLAEEIQKENGRFPSTVLAGLDLTDPNCREVLLQMKEHPLFRGLRVATSFHEDPSVMSFAAPTLMSSAEFRRGVSHVSDLGLILEIWCYSHQIPLVTNLADEFPNLSLVLNHVGTPVNIRDPTVFENWKRDLTEFAKRQNTRVKMCGWGMPLAGFPLKTSMTAEEVANAIEPYFTFVFNLFTVDRCYYASNFPVDGVLLNYQSIIGAHKLLLNRLKVSPEDQKKYFFANACAFYKHNP